ncbi:hypothetical protein Pse7367_1401 [Thalassoporum mexicanum PCC 7367]|uniref:hypothetical protein n=1 Tax=Thalassoporum mexicanum TaxID=3457544 RepID=UPI00029F9B4D|nr:hypothetical protein [Pseudanabaena sp. PCC 7367]AFY69692.1 hypothetical protein Pse7367_1401 [Pseudanabaena sp. PCC 7367]
MPNRAATILCLLPPIAALAISCTTDQSNPSNTSANDAQQSIEVATDATPTPAQSASGNQPETLTPGQYCFGAENENLSATAQIDLMADNFVSGTVNATVHNEELGYYTAYEQILNGKLDGNQLPLDITTNIELDTQNSQETWTISTESLSTGRQIFDRIDCEQLAEITKSPEDFNVLTASAQLAADRIGNVQIGMTLPEAEAAAKTTLLKAVNDPNQDCYFVIAQTLPTEVLFMVVDDRIARIDIPRGSKIKTTRGIGINSTEEAVKLAYSDIAVEPHKYTASTGGKYMTWQPQAASKQNYRLEFETDGLGVTAMRAGRLPEVGYVEGCS